MKYYLTHWIVFQIEVTDLNKILTQPIFCVEYKFWSITCHFVKFLWSSNGLYLNSGFIETKGKYQVLSKYDD